MRCVVIIGAILASLISFAKAEWVAGFVDGGSVIYPRDIGEPGPMFGCNDAGRRALFIGQNDTDFIRNLSNTNLTRDIDGRRIRLIVNGETVYKGRALYLPTWKMYQTTDLAAFRITYNAAVQGKSVIWKSGKGGELNLYMPPADDTFRRFAACLSR
ncbi:hypothetical protein HK107_11585 [Parvularcula sp. ZS-1/3]|uniref:Uncharacterized protein n=1 Tax=Parvularcula mediterranea TaxID=2732508 RepID=A0A7Y3RNS8_9PROT|nr:hypothetical protein [Parvularcula mediterranea]NNU16961.1 hypothetical protein [Parvularcula mediterranea]